MCGPVVGVSNDEHAAEALLTLASPADFTTAEDQQYVDAFDGAGLLLHNSGHSEYNTLGSQVHRDPNRFFCPFPGCKRSFAEVIILATVAVGLRCYAFATLPELDGA